MKHLRLLVFLTTLVLGSTTACNPFAASREPDQQLVEVTRGDLTIYASGSGNLDVAQEATLVFGVGGRVGKLSVKENESVTKGKVLATLDDTPLKLALIQLQVGLTQAQINLRAAEHNLAKAQETFTWPDIEIARADVDDAKAFLQYALDNLRDATTPEQQQTWSLAVARAQVTLASAEARLKAQVIGADSEEIAIKKMQVDLAKQSVDQAQQALAQAQKQLNDAVITAPFDGVVVKVSVDEGDTVTPLTNIIRLIDLGSLELKAAVDEIDIPKVRPGQTVSVTVDAFPEIKLEGEVASVSLLSVVQAGVVSYNVIIKFKNPTNAILKVGMSATADIVIEKRSNILLVPNRAIQESAQGKNRAKVSVNGQIQEREITVGISNGLETEVISGLSEGDLIAVETRSKSGSGGLLGQ